jgi:hypothetical protein
MRPALGKVDEWSTERTTMEVRLKAGQRHWKTSPILRTSALPQWRSALEAGLAMTPRAEHYMDGTRRVGLGQAGRRRYSTIWLIRRNAPPKAARIMRNP